MEKYVQQKQQEDAKVNLPVFLGPTMNNIRESLGFLLLAPFDSYKFISFLLAFFFSRNRGHMTSGKFGMAIPGR
jgi:hypothetical protein